MLTETRPVTENHPRYEGLPCNELPRVLSRMLRNALKVMPENSHLLLRTEMEAEVRDLKGWRAYQYDGGFTGAYFNLGNNTYRVRVEGSDPETAALVGKRFGFNPANIFEASGFYRKFERRDFWQPIYIPVQNPNGGRK